jgi:tetratricopeptide (TPR) repeat protein
VTDLSRWDHPWRLRAGNFRIATEVIGDHPWTGVGPGGFGEVFPQYRGPHDNETQHVHDVVLELGAELGVVPGAIASLVFFVLFLGPVFRRDEIEPWKRGLAVGLAAFAIQNLADFTAFLPSLVWLAALLRGLLVRPRSETAASPRPAPAFVLGPTLAATFLAAAIAALAGLSWNARFAARVAAAEGDLAAVEQHAERATSLAPWDVDSRLALAQAILTAGGTNEDANRRALGHAERAVTLSPVRPAARATRARARLGLGDAPGAWADLREAARLYPEREEYRLAADNVARGLPDFRTAQEEP